MCGFCSYCAQVPHHPECPNNARAEIGIAFDLNSRRKKLNSKLGNLDRIQDPGEGQGQAGQDSDDHRSWPGY